MQEKENENERKSNFSAILTITVNQSYSSFFLSRIAQTLDDTMNLLREGMHVFIFITSMYLDIFSK